MTFLMRSSALAAATGCILIAAMGVADAAGAFAVGAAARTAMATTIARPRTRARRGHEAMLG